MDGMARLAAMADELNEAQSTFDDLKRRSDELAQKIQELTERRIPELMDELEIASFKTSTGLKVEVATKINARKLTEAHEAALKWLRDNGQGALIKTAVSVPFSKANEQFADELYGKLEEMGYTATNTKEVHPQSLAAVVRGMMAEGREVPLELLGAYQRRVASVKQ